MLWVWLSDQHRNSSPPRRFYPSESLREHVMASIEELERRYKKARLKLVQRVKFKEADALYRRWARWLRVRAIWS